MEAHRKKSSEIKHKENTTKNKKWQTFQWYTFQLIQESESGSKGSIKTGNNKVVLKTEHACKQYTDMSMCLCDVY